MPGREKSFDTFISIAREIAKLPARILSQYQAVAQDIYQICQKFVNANEHLSWWLHSRWLHHFIYIDFRQQNACIEIIKALSDEVINRFTAFLPKSSSMSIQAYSMMQKNGV